MDEIQAEKDARKNKQIAYKHSLKALGALCQETLPGSKYDRFWVESMEKKLGTIEKVNELMEALKQLGEGDVEDKPQAF